MIAFQLEEPEEIPDVSELRVKRLEALVRQLREELRRLKEEATTD